MPIDFLFLEPRLLLFASCTRKNQTQTENLRKLWSLESLRLGSCLAVYKCSVIIACGLLKVIALPSEGDNSDREG
ncbi:hypothetical protein NC651_014890 [Populus alba x Populus x berolinensis]|nr:hypothetical protein NC651_014890 [Populus alba x Populus x berolinensis]